MESNNNEVVIEKKQESNIEKIKYPKRKYVIIHGYNGHQYKGNQKYINYII